MKPERALLLASLVLAAMAASSPLWWRLGPVDIFFFQYLAVGASLIVGGYMCSRWRAGRATARLMLLAGCLWFAPSIGYGKSALLFTIGLFLEGLWLTVVAHFVIAFPEGKLRSRGERITVGAVYAISLLIRIGLLFYDPVATDCPSCPRNLLLISSQPDLTAAFSLLGLLVQLAIAVAALAFVVRRWVRGTRPERRVLSPVFVAILLNIAAGLAVAVMGTLESAGLIPLAVFAVTSFLARLALLLLPISFGIGVARGVLARSAVGNLMIRIGEGRTAAEIERDVAWALADPTARLASRARGTNFRFVGDGGVVDVSDLPHDAVRLIEGSRGTTAALIHDPVISQFQPELLDAVVSAVRLALENQRLEAEASLAGTLPVGLVDRLRREGRQIGQAQTLTISVLMSDIRGYSTIAEHADLHDLAAQLNEHRAQMNRVITDAGGTVMQYVGDSVFAVFGAPEPTRDHARRAVTAALGMQAAQSTMNQAWQAGGRPEFGLGIAVTTGDVAAALLGSEEHVEYSVVGDVVNLAQRIQQWAAPGQVVISEQTRDQIDVREVPVVQLPTATVKGRRTPVTAYRLGTA
jgi:class 3 adenylate cyclase